jgi:hypothetical protein
MRLYVLMTTTKQIRVSFDVVRNLKPVLIMDEESYLNICFRLCGLNSIGSQSRPMSGLCENCDEEFSFIKGK